MSTADLTDTYVIPRHIAIIMDGNGRWAERRGLPRTVGHKNGVEAVRSAVRAAGELGVEYLTLYSFSTENWSRPQGEVAELFSLLRHFIRRDLAELHENNVVIKVIGEQDNVPNDILQLLSDAKALTAENTGQTLVIAFNYGSRTEIVSAAKRLARQISEGKIGLEDIDEAAFSSALSTDGVPDPDLLIRTGGELRISNFLLWQIAYSELVFLDCLWPDFGESDLIKAVEVFNCRTRTYGGLSMETGS